MFSLTWKTISYAGANMNKVHYENKTIYFELAIYLAIAASSVKQKRRYSKI